MRFQSFIAFALPALSSAVDLKSLLSSHPKLSTLRDLLSQFDLLEEFNKFENVTVIAPTNQAYLDLANWGFNLSQVPAPVAHALFKYHVLEGTHRSSDIKTHAKIVQTKLTPPVLTNVTAGAAVKLAKAHNNKIITESGLGVVGGVEEQDLKFDGGVVHTLNASMVLPHNITLTAQINGLAKFLGLMSKAGLTEEFEALKDVTVFIPRDTALQKIAGLLDVLSQKQLADILKGHVIANKVLYSKVIGNGGSYEALNGKKVHIKKVGNDGLRVNGVEVGKADVILYAGVAHIVEDIVLPLADEEEKKSIGYMFESMRAQVPFK